MKYLTIIFFGLVWGMSEVFLGEALYVNPSFYSPIILTTIAILILAFARGVAPYKFSSFALGMIAGLYRLVNAGYVCHVLAILLVGLAFEIVCAFLVKKESSNIKLALAGFVSPVLANVLFVLAMLVFKYPYWAGNWTKIFQHVFVTGGVVALMGAILVPVSFCFGKYATHHLKQTSLTS